MGAPVPASDLPDEHRAVPVEDLPPSVMDPRSNTVGQQLKRVGKALLPSAAGMGTAIGGAEAGGAVAGIPGAIVGGIAGGAAAPSVEAHTQAAISGQPVQEPTAHDVIKSAIINGVFTGVAKLGEVAVGAAKTEDAVRAELAKLPATERTLGKAKQIRTALKDRATSQAAETAKVTAQDIRNRDFWKAHGLNDQQIDEVLKTPDLQKQLAASIEGATKYKGAFQTVLDHQRADFKIRYDAVLGEHGAASVNPAPIAQQFEQLAQGAGQHELTPTFRNFLQRKAKEITGEQEAIDTSKYGTTRNASGAAAIRVSPAQLKALNAKLSGEAVEEGGKTVKDINGLRSLRTELRENLPASATNLDKQAANQLNQKLTQEIDSKLTEAGAKPEQIAGMHALDEEYGRFQDTIKKLDPRSGKFGNQIANLLFDKEAKNPEQALNFMSMAKAAEQANPGSVMPQLREALTNKLLAEGRSSAGPMDELKLLRKLQDQWGGDKASRAIMGEMFGKDDPLADPATFARVVEAPESSEPLKLAARNPQAVRSILSSPYFQGAIAYNMIAMAAGQKGGSPIGHLFNPKSPEDFAEALIGMGLGSVGIGLAIRTGRPALSRALVSMVNSPTAPAVTRYMTEFLGSGAASMSTGPTLPTPAETAAGR